MSNNNLSVQSQLLDWFLRPTPASGVRRVAAVGAALATETGLVREENQDRVAIATGRDRAGRTFVVAAVADGIGGMRDGAVCASKALATLFSTTLSQAKGEGSPEAWLEAAFSDANKRICEEHGLSGGTTLVALLAVQDYGICWASVGDSRLYAKTGAELVQLSMDDTIAGQLGRKPEIGLEQSKLLQFVGIGEPLEVRVERIRASSSDIALLSTDGIHFLDRRGGVFGLVVGHAPDIGTCVKRLAELARWAGGPDNASALAISLHHDRPMDIAPSGGLDVWDPFGELRIIEIATEMPAGVVAPTTSSNRTPPIPRTAPEANVASDKTDKLKPARTQPKRKKKPRKKPDLETKAPQVQLHFSGRDE